MPFVVPLDVEELVVEYLATGQFESGDDVLRQAMQAFQELDQDLAAVREAIDELKNGDSGVPLDEAFQQVRDHSKTAVE